MEMVIDELAESFNSVIEYGIKHNEDNTASQ